MWTYRKDMPKDLRLCCGRVNRGVAVLNDSVYYASIDAHLIALDATTGVVRWDVTMADYKTGHSRPARRLRFETRSLPASRRRVWRSRLCRRVRCEDAASGSGVFRRYPGQASRGTIPGKAPVGKRAQPPHG